MESSTSCEVFVSTCRVIPETGPKFLRGPARRTLHSRRTKESGWKAQGKYSDGYQRGAKRDSQRGDRGIPGDPLTSLQLLSSGGQVLCRPEEAEVGPADEGQQTSRRCLVV